MGGCCGRGIPNPTVASGSVFGPASSTYTLNGGLGHTAFFPAVIHVLLEGLDQD